MAESYRCPYLGCVRSVPRRMFACRVHWLLLPGPLRAAIWDGCHGSATDHLEAMAAALAWYADHAAGRAEEGRS